MIIPEVCKGSRTNAGWPAFGVVEALLRPRMTGEAAIVVTVEVLGGGGGRGGDGGGEGGALTRTHGHGCVEITIGLEFNNSVGGFAVEFSVVIDDAGV